MSPRATTEAFRAALEESLCRDSLADYIKLAWPIVEPTTVYLHNWHIELIAEYLTACTKGQIKRLAINIPPRYMKSLCVSIMWPTWVWGPRNQPGERWVFASYSQKLSTEHSVKRRAIMESPWYWAHWGDRVRFARDQNEKTNYMNTARGEMFAIPMISATGFGGNWFVIDDPHSTEDVVSRSQREAQLAFFDQALSVRHDDKFKGVTVIVMQRLAVDDLTGHVLKQGGYELLKVPGEAKGAERLLFPVSGHVHERQAGELLWPQREGLEQIAERKRALGARGYAGQYDQEPVPLGGAVFHSQWWRYYRDTPKEFDQVLISLDSAYKTKKENDHSVFTVWGLSNQKVYLLYVWRGKLEYPELKCVAAALIIRWHPHAVLVEDVGSGSSLVQEFKQTIRIDETNRDRVLNYLIQFGYKAPLNLSYASPPVLPIRPDKDKLARAEAVTPMVERGDVLLPDPNEYAVPWLATYQNEFARFTGLDDPEDDQVDATTQLLNYVRDKLQGFTPVEYYRRLNQMLHANSSNGICVNCSQPIEDNQPYTREMDRKWHTSCPSE
ncbi:MAG: hypothetical protein ACJ8FS_02025 [Sphingomicrobium sp.]